MVGKEEGFGSDEEVEKKIKKNERKERVWGVLGRGRSVKHESNS